MKINVDSLIAEKLFGLTEGPIPKYSTNIAEAWKVLEKIERMSRSPKIQDLIDRFRMPLGSQAWKAEWEPAEQLAESETAAMAISVAALDVVK